MTWKMKKSTHMPRHWHIINQSDKSSKIMGD